MEAICERCGKAFRTYPSRLAEGKGRYCSKACHFPESEAERFSRYVDKSGSCWLWTGNTNGGGYGTFKRRSRKNELAHRLAHELITGESLPPEVDCLHTCDTRNCVRNDEVGTYEVAGRTFMRYGHLFAATALENMQDMRAKGRSPDRRESARKAWQTKRAKHQVSLLPPCQA